MIADNYAWAGNTAIIYKVDLYSEHSSVSEHFINNSSSVTEYGMMIKKSTDSTWTSLRVSEPTNYAEGIRPYCRFWDSQINTDTTSGGYTYLFDKSSNYKSTWPIYVVIKGLDELTTYNLKSYYILNSTYYEFNSTTTTTTQSSSNVTYTCTGVTGGTETQNASLYSCMVTACDIVNSMTSFDANTFHVSQPDYLNTSSGGSFTGHIATLPSGAAADSRMYFAPAEAYSVGIIIHEMAHNIMAIKDPDLGPEYHNGTDIYDFGQTYYNTVKKFMEFASNVEDANWRWLNRHNYPVIREGAYLEVGTYLVAAACNISHTSNYNNDQVNFGNISFDAILSPSDTSYWDYNINSRKYTISKENNSDNPKELYLTGNSTFLAKPSEEANLSKINITYPNTDPMVFVYTVDNYALLFNRTYRYNEWDGGAQGVRRELYTINYLGNSSCFKSIKYVDENNMTFIEGMYINKTIRIPSNGTDNNREYTIKVHSYPYRFDSVLFDANYIIDNYISMYDYNGQINGTPAIYKIKNGNLYNSSNTSIGSVTDLTIFSSFNITYDGLVITINYKVKPNTSDNYKECVLCIGESVVHLFQENASDTRIYFGYDFSPKEYLDKNNGIMDVKWATLYSDLYYDYMFQGISSRVVSDGMSVNCPLKTWYMLYPESLTDIYTITTSGSGNAGTTSGHDESEKDGYTLHALEWNGQKYIYILSIANTITYNFTRK